jgi:hypothetical protein
MLGRLRTVRRLVVEDALEPPVFGPPVLARFRPDDIAVRLGDLRSLVGRCRKWSLTTIEAVAVGVTICGACAGQELPVGRSTSPLAFHIPSQPLASALQSYGESAGVQVLYESRSAVERTSMAVEGSFTPEEALVRLLAGTDLKIQYTRSDAVTLVLRSAQPDGPPDSAAGVPELSLGTLRVRPTGAVDDVGRLHDYSENLQLDIQKVLQKNAGTRGGNYRAVLDLWIDPLRSVHRIALVGSTGNQGRDTAVAAALRGLAVSRPPPENMPQPVRVVIVVKSMQ